MVANKWIGNYYLGSSGAMLTSTTTPDGYKVDASGKWIQETSSDNVSLKLYDVVRVKDGDTIVVNYNGKKETVRLIGVDTPESVHPDKSRNTEAGVVASNFTKSQLNGKKVGLEFDVQECDRYGRLLAYVYLDGKMFNETLLEKGYAKLMTIPPNVKYVDRFKSIINGNAIHNNLNYSNSSSSAWKQDSNGWWYQNNDGSYPKSQWKKINNKWYYFNGAGYLVVNSWVGDYYVNSNGEMLTNTTTPDGYKVGKNGKWIQENSNDNFRDNIDSSSRRIKGNKKSKIYNLPCQKDYDKISDDNVVWFDNEYDAISAGYRRAKR